MKITRPSTICLRNQINRKLDRSLEKLSSGQRISGAADDAAGLAISEGLKAERRGMIQALRNVQEGLSLLQTVDGGLSSIEDNLQRMRVLAVQAGNGTLTTNDRAKLNDELSQLVNGIDDIAENTTYNGAKVLRTPLYALPTAQQKADIVFVVDNTGSMLSVQEKVRDSLLKMLNKIKALGVADIRAGLLEYRDATFNQMNFPSGKWTNKSSEILQAFNNVIGTNSGSIENTMQALQETLGRYDFRANVGGARQKHVIVVTDEGADDAGLAGAVLTQLQAQEVNVHAVFNFNVGAGTYNLLVENTGGQALDISGASWGEQLGGLFGKAIGQESGFVEGQMPGLRLQVGPNANDVYQLDLHDVRSEKLAVDKLSLASPEQALRALSAIDTAIDQVSRNRADYGGHLNRLREVQNLLTICEVNTAAGESTIGDVDMPGVIMELTRHQMLAEVNRTFSAQAERISRESLLNLLDALKD